MAKRLEWIDATKGFLILMVVLGHIVPEHKYIWNLIYSFHMPAFVAVSGYLSFSFIGIGGKQCILCIYRRFRQIMIPFLIWSVIMFYSLHNVSHLYDYMIYPQKSYWFLWGLFFIVCIFYVIDLLSERFHIKHELLVTCTAFILTGVRFLLTDPKFLGYEYVSYYFLYYALGYYIRKYKQLIPNNSWILFVMFVGWFVLGSFWKPLPGVSLLVSWISFIPTSLLNLGYRMVTAILSVLLIVGVGSKMIVGKNWIWRKLMELGKLSLGIYVVHMVLKELVKYVVFILLPTCPELGKLILSYVLLIVISYCFVRLLNRWKVTSVWLLGKV